MKSKQERFGLLKQIIRENVVSKQEQLLALLAENGVRIAQATLSRDLKEINAGIRYDKALGAVYYLNDEAPPQQIDNVKLHGALLSIEFSNQMAVIRTIAGFANSAAAIIDQLKITNIMGTIAGDDTVLIILRENYVKDEILSQLNKVFPAVYSVLK